MASNDALIKQANELAEQLETPVKTDGLSNAALVSLVGNLRTGVATAEAEAVKATAEATADAEAANAAEAADAVRARDADVDAQQAAEAAEDPPPFVVAPGTSITKMGGGIIGPGDEIMAANLSGGQVAIDAFVKAGKIVKG